MNEPLCSEFSNEATIKRVRAAREYIKGIDDGYVGFLAAAVFICIAAASLIATVVYESGWFVIAGITSYISFLVWIYTYVYASRSWTLSRAIFEIITDDIIILDADPTLEPKPEPPPEPEPDVMQVISADEQLMALLKDMPTAKLQALIDAKSIQMNLSCLKRQTAKIDLIHRNLTREITVKTNKKGDRSVEKKR